ncbi:MAG: metal ABC transporter permease [Patescibacteria group bacterium]|nr:metal ABC transporter permease [Patescibacteria group bacterium]
MFINILQYGFIVRGLEAGVIVALIAPLIGIFLVLRRYSLIADTLAHVSLAGIAIGLFFGINPVMTALGTAVVASLGIEKLRVSKKIYGESALALFLSGSLALAIVILSLARGFNANLFNYLFGSIVTVTPADVWTIAILALVTIIILFAFFKELVFISFDEEAARVAGIPVRFINAILIILAALTVSLSIPIVGVLLISALIVIPVVTALQLKLSFIKTIIWAEIFSVASVIAGIFTSFYFNLSTGGAIVLIMLAIFIIIYLFKKNSN